MSIHVPTDGKFIWQFLLAYAGPTSNVRVELASLDRFRNGSAVDEVISLYEDIRADDKEIKVQLSEEGMSCLSIHVGHFYFLSTITLFYFGGAFLQEIVNEHIWLSRRIFSIQYLLQFLLICAFVDDAGNYEHATSDCSSPCSDMLPSQTVWS